MTDTFRALCAEMVERLGELDGLYNIPSQAALIERASAALAEEPATPAPPADGEVAELVAWLRHEAESQHPGSGEALPSDMRDELLNASTLLTRAAELLERQALVPVPVSERLPGPEDCDAEGRCWWFESDESCGYGSSWTLLRIKGSATPFTHWRPAHALPLPEMGE